MGWSGKVGGGGVQTRLPFTPSCADYRRTQLAPYVKAFEQFVEEMERGRRVERLRRSGERRGCSAPSCRSLFGAL